MMMFVTILEREDKMRKSRELIGNLLVTFVALFLIGCVDYQLSDSVWLNTSYVEKDGVKGDLVRVLHFKSIDSVDYYCLVKSDTGMVVTPFRYACGLYVNMGNPRKEANVAMKMTNINGKSLVFQGMYHKADAMVLISNDTIMRVFGKWQAKKKNQAKTQS